MKLYGSIPSPFVRRIRMYLDGHDYEFAPVNVYDDKERARYAKISPLKKLPVLIDGDQTIWDSGSIYQYLRGKHNEPPISPEELNLLSAIDAANDSLVIVMMGRRSGIEVSPDKLLFKLQLERVPDILAWLEQQVEAGKFKVWNYPTIALYSLLDWVLFRELFDLEPYPALRGILTTNAERACVQDTDPRQAA